MADSAPRLVLQAFRFEVRLTRSPTVPPPARPGAPGGERQRVTPVEQLGDGGFQECTGLDLEADIKEYLEGGRNDSVIRRVGRVKLQPLVLKRGMFAPSPPTPTGGAGLGATTGRQGLGGAAGPGGADGRVIPDLWLWLQEMVGGRLPVPRFDGVINVRGPAGEEPRATWRFVRGLPMKVVGPSLHAKTGELAIEELHIAHEGLWLDAR
jgi:T4-like virus tail tube protein gp19